MAYLVRVSIFHLAPSFCFFSADLSFLLLIRVLSSLPSSSSYSSCLLCRELPTESSYFWDTKGDRNNLVFSSLYRQDIPLYYRGRRVLGAKAGERIVGTKAG